MYVRCPGSDHLWGSLPCLKYLQITVTATYLTSSGRHLITLHASFRYCLDLLYDLITRLDHHIAASFRYCLDLLYEITLVSNLSSCSLYHLFDQVLFSFTELEQLLC